MAGEEQDRGRDVRVTIAFAQEVGWHVPVQHGRCCSSSPSSPRTRRCACGRCSTSDRHRLSLVMVINFALMTCSASSCCDTPSAKGMMHMEYGQHMMKGMTNLIGKNALTRSGTARGANLPRRRRRTNIPPVLQPPIREWNTTTTTPARTAAEGETTRLKDGDDVPRATYRNAHSTDYLRYGCDTFFGLLY